MEQDITKIDFSKGDNLVPIIVQDANTKEILTLAYSNKESLERALTSGNSWFWSRSRKKLWMKGEESGNTQKIRKILVDCDSDALIYLVEPAGPACHTGEASCFFNQLEGLPEEYEETQSGPSILGELFALIKDRQEEMPEGSYTSSLFNEGVPRIAQKVVEEAAEAAIAAAINDAENVPGEIADMLYHTLVLLAASDIQPEAVYEKLRERRK